MHSKGNHKQNEKTTHRMGENICKQSDQQGINLQNIQTDRVAPYQKKKKTNPIKNVQIKQKLLQRKQMAKKHKKMLNITNYLRNANQN